MSRYAAPVATVADIMDREPAAVAPDDSVEKVIDVMQEHELPGVPVVDASGACVGIITESDLVISDENADLHLPHYIQLFGATIFLEPLKPFEHKLKKAFASTAADMMTADPITIAPDAPVEEAARVIAERRHNRLPVVQDGRLIGMVTRLDVLDALHAG